MSNRNGKWMLNRHNSEYWNAEDVFNTEEEAVKTGVSLLKKYNSLDKELKSEVLALSNKIEDTMGIASLGYETITRFDVGLVEQATVEFNVDSILETATENAYDEYGEFAEDYLEDVTDEDKTELETLIHDWFIRHNYIPQFYKVYNIETIDLNDFSEERL